MTSDTERQDLPKCRNCGHLKMTHGVWGCYGSDGCTAPYGWVPIDPAELATTEGPTQTH